MIAAFTSPVAPSTARFEALFWSMTTVCGAVAALVLAAMIGLVLRFHQRHARGDAEPIVHENAIEVTWTLLTLGVFCVLFWFGTQGFRDLDPRVRDDAEPLDDALDVMVTAERWLWTFEAFDGPRELDVLHVPAGRTVRLHMSSTDVIHSFFVPAFRLKHDVLPDRTSTIWFRADTPGRYPLLCAEYCGRNHSQMRGEIVVVAPTDYEAWVSARLDETITIDSGAALFHRHGCQGCHFDDGTGHRQAPSLEGLYGRRERLADGREIVVDETYLRESIMIPDAARLADWPPSMPSYAGRLSEAELTRLVLYLSKLDHADAREQELR